MIDTNLLNNASNILVQAGYTVTPPAIKTALTGLETTIVTSLVAIAGVLVTAITGRVVQALRTGNGVASSLIMGTNSPKVSHSAQNGLLPVPAKVAMLFFAASLLALTGCGTIKPLLTPAALQGEISTGVALGLDVSPQSAKDVALARDVICASAQSTNVSPASIVADMAQLGVTNTTSKVIINGGFFLFEDVLSMLGTNATLATIEPYLVSTCNGFTDGLNMSPAQVAQLKKARASKAILLPPHLK